MTWFAGLPQIARRALLGGAALTVLLFASWGIVFHIGAVQRIDASIYNGFYRFGLKPHVGGIANAIANLCDPVPYVFLCLAPVLLAIRRDRFLLAAVILAILLAANVTTEVLKPLMAAPRPDEFTVRPVGEPSWPSGHATASMSLALCTLLACPPNWRPRAAALGAAFALAVTYSFLSLGWHYPSDVLGGYLVASAWTLFGAGGYAAFQSRRSVARESRPARVATIDALAPSLVVLSAAVLVVAAVALVRPEAVLDYVRSHKVFVVGAGLIGGLAVSLSAGVMMTLRR